MFWFRFKEVSNFDLKNYLHCFFGYELYPFVCIRCSGFLEKNKRDSGFFYKETYRVQINDEEEHWFLEFYKCKECKGKFAVYGYDDYVAFSKRVNNFIVEDVLPGDVFYLLSEFENYVECWKIISKIKAE